MQSRPDSFRPSLSTSADLEADQTEFFRRNLSPDALPSSTEDAIAALSLARDKPSATAALLEPIQERQVARRRRKARPKEAVAPFPPVQAVRGFSKFGRAARKDVSGDNNGRNGEKREGLGQSDEQILGMSAEQLAEAHAEIESLLSADSIKFLKERGKGGPYQNQLTETTKAHEKTKNGYSEGTRSYSDDKLTNRGEKEQDQDNIEREVGEAEKRMWMTDANENVGDQEEVDSLVATAVKDLGALGERRFDLEGEALSPEEANTLPMHLGLHHHGSAPTMAGYTLADLLLLTRSSVVTQRVLALRILTVLVRRHRSEVLEPLVKSGGLALVFAEFPAYAAFESARTVQTTYVDAVEAIIGDFWDIPEEELVPGLYFASRFYTGSLWEQQNPSVEVLARSGCLGLLANIARASAHRTDEEGLTRRSLSMIRAIAKTSVAAARTIVEVDSLPGKILQQLACNSDFVNSSPILLSCDALAQAVVNTGLENDEALQILDETVLNDEFLRKLSLHLAWFSEDRFLSPPPRKRNAALGALRMFRAAMAFERGVMPFTSIVQNVCQLSQDVETSAESYLALEAYAHTLYTLASTTSDSESAKTESRRTKLEHGFAADQLVGLIPIAISSARLFTSLRSPGDVISISRKAAAGHFTATVLGTTTIPVNRNIVAQLLSDCSATALKMVSHVEEARAVNQQQKCHETLMHVQGLASVSHAGVRMLSKVSLDPLYAKRELLSLVDCAKFEGLVLGGASSLNPWRPIANVCVEWVASLAKVNGTRETVAYGIELLPMLFDPQVVLDLLSRCILMAKALSEVSNRISLEIARKCAEDLLPIVLSELKPTSSEEKQKFQYTKSDKETQLDEPGLISLRGLLELWITHAETPDSWLWISKAFYDAKFVTATELFHCLLKSPAKFFLDDEYLCLLFILAEEAYVTERKLLQREETVLSSVSTTRSSESVEALQAMTECLASRGPQPANMSKKPDYLASVVLSVMCDTQADVSLRLSMWRKTIIECGGGMLFQNARYIPTSTGSPGTSASREDDSMLFAFSNAIVEGLLQGERCPNALAAVLAMRFDDALRNGDQGHVLDPLKESLNGESQGTILSTVRVILNSERNEASTSMMSKWVQERMTYLDQT
eukprot:GFKZ01006146.1.p1 GENE.GFKZ01006146.1~~GFKZ01006146.1.p1  ORF type:complete len:1132 (-),score=157.90 GFKZ01006146.1:2681-6076(-)